MPKSLNRVQLIGNLTRDPELRYTPSGTAVTSFGIATNRSWTTDQGEKHDETEFHNIVAWAKLAELCSQFLIKGRKVYVEGRLTTRSWTSQDNQQKTRTEIVIDDMILLDSKGQGAGTQRGRSDEGSDQPAAQPKRETKKETTEDKQSVPEQPVSDEEIAPDDIPF